VASYAAKYIQGYGQSCSVTSRTPNVTTYISLKRSSKSTSDPGARDALWEGLALLSSSLISGEIVTIDGTRYLVQSTNKDLLSGELAVFLAKSNVTLTHKRISETADANFNITNTWTTKNSNVYGYGSTVNREMSQQDPGVLPETVYHFQVPSSINALIKDRMVFDGNNYEVVSIDDIGLSGVVRLQLGVDNRP